MITRRRLLFIGALGAPTLVAVVLALWLSMGPGSVADAGSPQFADLSLGLDIDGDGTDDCTTKAASPQKCEVEPNTKFTVKLSVNDFSTLSGVYDFVLATAFFAGLNWQPRAGFPNEIVGPHCELRPPDPGVGEVDLQCIGTTNATGYVVFEVDFTCKASGGANVFFGSSLRDQSNFKNLHDGDRLDINCPENTPTPTATATATATATPTVTETPEGVTCSDADVTGDGKVTRFDWWLVKIGIWLERFGLYKTWLDVDGDGDVDTDDLRHVKDHLGEGC